MVITWKVLKQWHEQEHNSYADAERGIPRSGMPAAGSSLGDVFPLSDVVIRLEAPNGWLAIGQKRTGEVGRNDGCGS